VDPPPRPPSNRALLDTLEGELHDLLHDLPEAPKAPRGPGAPPVLSACLFWAALLVCVLRGFSSQQSLWQLVCVTGLWDYATVSLTRQAIYLRLQRTQASRLLVLFEQCTLLLRQRFVGLCDVAAAPFASEILALDHSTLDAVARRLQLFRGRARNDPALIPGQLATLFDVRQQLFWRAEFIEDAARNEKHHVEHWLAFIPRGALLLFDLGFFAFRWFDTLTTRDYFFVCRQRDKISTTLIQLLYDGPAGPVRLRESLVYLGAYRADRGAHPVRLIEVFTAHGTYRYLTNVLDPRQLSAREVMGLYRRRWDIETAFKLLKSHLNLFLIWSGHPNVVLLQLFATLLVAQLVLSVRNEVAELAGVGLREISLYHLIRWIPEIARRGQDPVATLVRRGRYGGIIRPFRGRPYDLPEVAWEAYALPEERPPPRQPRYAGKQGKPGSNRQPKPHRGARKHGWGLRQRRLRTA
jgi:Transposase DDE domain